MIVDYIIDLKYFVKLIRESTPLDMRCQCALRLLEIARYENGRFVIDAKNADLETLKEGLISDENGGGGSVSLFGIKRDFVLSEYYIGLFLPYGVITDRPCKRASNGSDTGFMDAGFMYRIGNGENATGLVQYFQEKDCERRRYLGKQTFFRKGMNRHAISFAGFDAQLKVFAAAEERGFVIVDPYCLGGRVDRVDEFLEEKTKVLMRWVYYLACHGTRPVRFDIYTACPYEENGRNRNYRAGVNVILEENENHASRLWNKLRQHWENSRLLDKSRNDKWPIMICFHIFTDGNWLIHDRFVGSTTHFFAMGRGLDGVLASRDGNIAYNIYYCGKKDIREEPDVKRILDYEINKAGTPNVTFVEYPLDGYMEE